MPIRDHLAIGGYSYGGYMTNWLITQTTRFKSAVTGAGAVEHAANWGNDDETWDDAWYLGGRPWENPELYQDEAALFQLRQGEDAYAPGAGRRRHSRQLSSRARRWSGRWSRWGFRIRSWCFRARDTASSKNPWHGYIKLREELKWLEKYDKQ